MQKPTVVVTGVLGGVGGATATLFAQSGYYVIGCDRRQTTSSPDSVDLYVHADVSTEEGVALVFRRASEETGRVDVLVNNAALQVCKPLLETSTAEWDAVFASNLRSVFLAVRYVHPLMRTAGGSIVNVSSVHANATSANIAAYAASKGGVLALTRSLAIELSTDRIRVNAVLPGAVDTSMLRAGLSRGSDSEATPELLAQLAKKHLRGSVGQPAEIAQAIYFLAREDSASFITGQSLIVDGGATCRLSTE
jgi:glucose 1-dehydrogenase